MNKVVDKQLDRGSLRRSGSISREKFQQSEKKVSLFAKHNKWKVAKKMLDMICKVSFVQTDTDVEYCTLIYM
jgi:hypothetical protein